MDGPGSFFNYLNFLLQFCPVDNSETDLRQRFATFGIGAGLKFDFAGLSPELQLAVNAGLADVGKEMAALQQQVNRNEVGELGRVRHAGLSQEQLSLPFCGSKTWPLRQFP